MMMCDDLDITLTDSNDTHNKINDEYFSFKIIFATGAKVDLFLNESKGCDITTFEMLPVYVEFDGKLFFFQHVLPFGKDFSVNNNEQFFTDRIYDQTNTYYVGDEYDNDPEDYLEKFYSIYYFNLEYKSCALNVMNIIKKLINPRSDGPSVTHYSRLYEDEESKKNKYIQRSKNILSTLSNKKIIDQVISLVAHNPTFVKKYPNVKHEFYDDVFGLKCDVTFRVATGNIKFKSQ